MAPGRQDPPGDRHRAEPAEPAGRVRPGHTRPGHRAEPGHRAVRRGRRAAQLHRPERAEPESAAASNPLNPETIVLALATLGMLLIALVAVGGFTVLAQRRLRALGMLEALGATDRHVRLVVRTNGVVVGVVGALAGAVLGLAAWLAYRPQRRGQRAPRDRHLPAAVDRDRPGHGRWPCWPPTSRPRGRPGPSPGCPSWPPCPGGPRRPSKCTARSCRASSCW